MCDMFYFQCMQGIDSSILPSLYLGIIPSDVFLKILSLAFKDLIHIYKIFLEILL